MLRIRDELIAALLISLSYISILLYYTHGALLWGGDYFGYFSAYNFLSYPDPSSFIYAIASISSAGNYYAGFYIYLFLSALLTLLGMYLLVYESFSGIFDKKALFRMGTIASLLYLFNPTSIVYNFSSFTANVFVTNAAFFLFLAMLIRIWRLTKEGSPYQTRDFLLLGLRLWPVKQRIP